MGKICLVILGAWFFIFYPAYGFSMENGVDIHGFISQGYMLTTRNNYIVDSTDGTFQFNEMGLNFTTNPTDKLRMGAQFFARDFGTVGNDKIVVDWAFADYRFKDWLGFRAGKIKNPMGLYNETRDIDMLRTSILLPVGVYDEPYRETVTGIQGAGIYGDINSERFGTLNYQFLCGTNNIDNDGGTALFVGQGNFDVEESEVKKVVSGALVYTDPTGSLRVGGTAYFIEMNFGGPGTENLFYNGFPLKGFPCHLDVDYLEIYTTSIEWTWDQFVFAYEYSWGNSNIIASIEGFEEQGLKYPYEPVGYYGSVSYRFNQYLEAGYFRMEYFFLDDNRNGTDFPPGEEFKAWQKEDVFSLRIDINENWIVKLETHYIDGTVKLYKQFNPDGDKHYWWMNLAKISFKF